MQQQQFNTSSRLSQWAQQQASPSNIPISQSSISIGNSQTSQQFKKLRHIPMSKLGLNQIFVKKQHEKNFYKRELFIEKVNSCHNQFYQLRERYQEDVYRFVKKYQQKDGGKESSGGEVDGLEQFSSYPSSTQISMYNLSRMGSYDQNPRLSKKQFLYNYHPHHQYHHHHHHHHHHEHSQNSPSKSKEKSRQSSKKQQGGYFFNNWRSYQNYYCTKAVNTNAVISQEDGDSLAAHLVYAVIDMDYQRGLKIIQKILEVSTGGYRTSQNLGGNGEKIEEKQKGKDKEKEKIEGNTGGKINQTVINNNNKNNNNNTKKQPTPKQTPPTSHQDTLHLASLKIIIKGLKTLCSIIKLADQLNNNTQLSQTFFNREQFNLLQDHYLNDARAKINLLAISVDDFDSEEFVKSKWEDSSSGEDKKKFDKKPSYNLKTNSPKGDKKIMRSTQNLMNYKSSPKKPKSIQQLRSFLQLQPKYQKICLLNNLMFLINFTKRAKISSCQNDYYKLLFCYLKNSQDQLQFVMNGLDGEEDVYAASYSNMEDVKGLSSLIELRDDDCSNLSQSSVLNFGGRLRYNADVDYALLLVQLRGIKIYDRINLATRLLSKPKKVKFTQQLLQKIVRYPYLDNLLLFTRFYKQQLTKSQDIPPPKQPSKQQIKKTRKNSTQVSNKWSTLQLQVIISLKQKQHTLQQVHRNNYLRDTLSTRIKTICQNYIDEYGDVATIAYLSIEYQCLQKYYDCYRESLLLSYEHQEVDKLDVMREGVRKEHWTTEKRSMMSRKCGAFLEAVNFKQEKVNQQLVQQSIETMDCRRCQICSIKMTMDRKQCYIECGKCRHGGHLEHIIKWYANYQNCPNVNCACVCN